MSTRSGQDPAPERTARTRSDGEEPERLRRARELHRRQRAYVLASVLTLGRADDAPLPRPAPRF
jgi:hypothetical protein